MINRPDKNRISDIIERFNGKKILIVGDIMIDEYLSGKVHRISPEAPVPIVEISEEILRFGGAANVALNVKTLGCEPILIGLIGKDRMAENLDILLQNEDMETAGLVQSDIRPTTVKTRIIGDNQHIARVDKEILTYADIAEEKALMKKIEFFIKNADAVIIEDYNKGVLTENIIEFTIQQSSLNDIPVSVDPKFVNFMKYKNVNIFKPNIKETERALARHLDNDQKIIEAGFSLKESLRAESVLLTRGSRGMSLFEGNDDVTHIPTQARNVSDVSGAGDTVISTMTAACIAGASKKEAAYIANIAAGIVVEEVGIIPISKDALLNRA
ncbi:MAG: D-glycero-beta-D-manno-heptose-7-phosphate kinase [Calditrichae bacterium]|nr:D-glycero-beta-D-manno-heptose-7-phosphate kinase [Calditrichota bacterium]MCB9057172.1 D-glycero-beta-D-manno-heptose-7-phosphate kinase [Calditrichia bacterium]